MKKLIIIPALFLMAVLSFAAVYSSYMEAYAGAQAEDGCLAYNEETSYPVIITGTINGKHVKLDISGGIEIRDISGTRDNNSISASMKKESGFSLPDDDRASLTTFTWMPQLDQKYYSMLVNTGSRQYQLNRKCTTDSEGFRKYGDSYLVALGSFYGSSIGEEYMLCFEGPEGNSFVISAVLGDQKSDAHTDKTHRYHMSDGSVVEFIMGSNSSNNQKAIASRFKRLISISKGIDVELKGSIKGTSIFLEGTISGVSFSATGRITDGRIDASGTAGIAENGSLSWPVPGRSITSYFGIRAASDTAGIGSINHMGIDIAADTGTAVCSAADGTVRTVSYDSARGRYIVIHHNNGLETWYEHLSRAETNGGSKVRRGEKIALSGNTGNSTGPHLHFEVRKNGEAVNPLGYLDR